LLERGQNRKTPDELRDHPEGKQVLGFYGGEGLQLLGTMESLLLTGMEPQRLSTGPALDDLVEADEGPSADEEDVLRVKLDVFLMGMLAAALWRDVAGGSLEDLAEGPAARPHPRRRG